MKLTSKQKVVIFVVALAIAVVFSFASTAHAETRHYLNAGADPQHPDRQPTVTEEIVQIDQDLCDPGWGSGHGRVSGCYRKGEFVLRDKFTGFVTAMLKCGNEPSQQHLVTGKVIELPKAPEPELKPEPVAPALTPVPAPAPPPEVVVNPCVNAVELLAQAQKDGRWKADTDASVDCEGMTVHVSHRNFKPPKPPKPAGSGWFGRVMAGVVAVPVPAYGYYDDGYRGSYYDGYYQEYRRESGRNCSWGPSHHPYGPCRR